MQIPAMRAPVPETLITTDTHLTALLADGTA
jgi:hypothetical protein